eukprot:c10343_g1_i1 orf=271-651(+)
MSMRQWRSKSISEEKAAALYPNHSPIALKEDLKSSESPLSANVICESKKDLKSSETPESSNKVCKAKKSNAKKHDVKKKDHLISLEQDVQHLQRKLNGQKATKGFLEQALAHASSVPIPVDGNCIS